LASIHEQLREKIVPGITTNQINAFVHQQIEAAGATAAQIGFEGYEFATCISVNEEICHGFPSEYVLKSGDVVKVDFCVDYKGAISDSCWTYAVGEISPEHQALMEVTKEALMRGIKHRLATELAILVMRFKASLKKKGMVSCGTLLLTALAQPFMKNHSFLISGYLAKEFV
jgi:methionine aminopeptidase